MNHIRCLLIVLTVAVAVVGGSSRLHAQGASATSAAKVRLKESAEMMDVSSAGLQIKLGDIANITDSDAARRAALMKLDLATWDPDQETTISRGMVEIRILLAGYDSQQVVLSGPDQVVVGLLPKVALTDLGVEQTVFDTLCRQFSIAPEDLRVKLVTPFVGPSLPALEGLVQPRLELMPPPQLPLGRSQLTVRVLDGNRVVAARQLSFEIARRQPVVVATNSLDRGNLVSEEHVREETRFVDGPVDRLTAAQVIGRRVLLPFRPDEVVTLRHVGQPTEVESPILVQPRDAVRLIAKKRGLTVTIPVAEALQAGREGQLIRVRNVQSNQVVTGVVVGRGEVHVRLP